MLRGRAPLPVGAALVAVAAAGLAGCFTTATDYQRDAADTILDDAAIAKAAAERVDRAVTFTSVTCEKPENQDAGTSFTCTAFDDTGADWEFGVEIRESGRYDIELTRPP